MTAVFDQSVACGNEIEKRFRATGDLIEHTVDERLGVTDIIFSSMRYRRAHISIVDARATKKIWMLHVTVFPHFNDPSPIYGIDIVAGPNKVSGAFHDFSISGDAESPMWLWFNAKTKVIEWNRPRQLPEWAQHIFSPAMVAIGAVGPDELEQFIKLGLETLDFYLANVGFEQQDVADYHMAQNKYCRYQKQNPHTPRVLINLGFTEQEAKNFIHTKIFPELQ
jgi:phycocyanobilin:ferredoxin oxidoreductase